MVEVCGLHPSGGVMRLARDIRGYGREAVQGIVWEAKRRRGHQWPTRVWIQDSVMPATRFMPPPTPLPTAPEPMRNPHRALKPKPVQKPELKPGEFPDWVKKEIDWLLHAVRYSPWEGANLF